MRKCPVVLAVLGLGLMFIPRAEAVMANLGGTIYVTERYANAADCSTYLRLKSYQLNPDWTWSGWRFQGDIMDNNDAINGSGTRTRNAGVAPISPEVETYGGQNYGTIVMGMYYNNSYQSPRTYTNAQTMDIVRIQPVASGTATVTVLGDGKIGVGTNGWGDWQQPARPHTEVGYLTAPDPAAQFTGGAGKYLLHVNDYNACLFVVTNVNPGTDCDCTNDDSDFIVKKGKPYTGIGNDFEILGNKYMSSTGWDGAPWGGCNDINYVTRLSLDCTTITPRQVFVADSTGGGVKSKWNIPGLALDDTLPFAAGKVNGHDTVWARATYGGVMGIYCFEDMDDNGIITPGEFFCAYTAADSTQLGDDPNASWRDIEWVRNADGKMFLLGLNGSNNANYGNSFVVIQLDDNGDYTGGDDRVRAYTEYVPGTNKTQRNFELTGTSMEFDLNAVPEPATMILIGTGVLSAAGFLRRRKRR
jgi:hypothetical protein